MQYQWIFFDADETLFSFDSFAGLQRVFAEYDVDFTQQDYVEYQAVNKPLWVKYQDGEITAEQLQTERFRLWAERVQVSPEQLNQAFLLAMADICKPLVGVETLLASLKERCKFAIITNGFSAMQQLRLHKTGLQHYFDFVVVSEELGVSKPDVRIFDYALQLAKVQDRRQVLMVGDTLESDILGGQKANLDTCWLSYGRTNSSEIKPTYQVEDMPALLHLFNTAKNKL